MLGALNRECGKRAVLASTMGLISLCLEPFKHKHTACTSKCNFSFPHSLPALHPLRKRDPVFTSALFAVRGRNRCSRLSSRAVESTDNRASFQQAPFELLWRAEITAERTLGRKSVAGRAGACWGVRRGAEHAHNSPGYPGSSASVWILSPECFPR